MRLLDGKIARDYYISHIREEIKNATPPPHITIILVGNHAPSQTYVNIKIKTAQKAGFQTKLIQFDAEVTQKELIATITEVQEKTDGLIVQLPLPKHIDESKVIDAISPNKDIDGFHPLNFGRMALGQKAFRPATAYGIAKLMQYYNIPTKGKHIVVIGRSDIVGKPIAIMLGNEFDIGRGTVTSCQIHTPPALLKQLTLSADIIIVAVGKPGFLTSDMVSEGVVVIDVGINRLDNGKLVGDVDFENVAPKCSCITPVPGGVGPMTIAGIIINTYLSYNNEINYNLKF